MPDTIFALSSGRPPAGIAVIRTSGPDAFAVGEAIAGALPAPRQAALRTLRDPNDGSAIDDALVLCFPEPATVTGENVVEYQCHGGRAVIHRLLEVLSRQPGLREAEPGEFTRRALANGRLDLTEAEGLADLLEAETELQRRVALGRMEGSVRRQLADWRERLVSLSAQAEVAIDYADEEDGGHAFDLEAPARALTAEMTAMLDAPRVERLRDGLRVVVAGPPNAGKSSLMNALARSKRALVTPIAGTTRDAIEVPLDLGGVPIVLVDTAGLRETDDEIETMGISLAERELKRADLILWLGDEETAPTHTAALSVTNKVDLGHTVPPGSIGVSALTGVGLDRLVERLGALARDLLPAPSNISLTEREAGSVRDASNALERAVATPDLARRADEFRAARHSLDRVTGGAGIEDVLDVLFGRFCLGK